MRSERGLAVGPVSAMAATDDALVFLGSMLVIAACHKTAATPVVCIPRVRIVKVVQRDVPLYREWIGTLDGFVNAEVKAQVAGYIRKQVVVGADGKLQSRSVATGEQIGAWLIITQGVRAGEKVIVSDLARLAPGMAVCAVSAHEQ